MQLSDYTDVDWSEAKEEARNEMILAAKRRSVITYGCICKKITAVNISHIDGRFYKLLCDISREESEKDRGMLSVVVVAKSDGRPGDGFFDFAATLGYDVSEKQVFFAKELNKVYEYWSRN
ncbi:hypothetical protein [Blastochloris sulfoviridis]|uniref:Uncharacterized protein n=1 Tax=Blastochloris sulfoviridis TaxID=50712 RepID=A0A5M6I5N1_9HYPH|nr:hypothetical protein [Blastochloris sulfoviridis]KAA5603556.1 hypothetical protein F1193_00220 [Blastochloris sulfoviridis]